MFLGNARKRRIPQGKEYSKSAFGLVLILIGIAIFVLGIEVIGLGLGIAGFVIILDSLMLLRIITLDDNKPSGKRSIQKELTMIGQ